MLPLRLDFHVFIIFLQKKTALVPDNADLFSFLLSFLFLPARGKYLHKATHTHSLSLSDIFSPDRALSRRHVEPTVECAPQAEKIYYTFFSGSFVFMCVFFFKYKYAYDFPFIFQLLLLPVWFIYISRTIAYIFFVVC